MKVDVALRDFFQQKKVLADQLKSTVDPIIQANKEESWHYQSRVKQEESFALKLETGLIKNLEDIEDFFAGVIVVPTAADIPAAVKVVTDRFSLGSRRPQSAARTHKSPDSFPFDDLRLYVRYEQAEWEPPVAFDGMLFEIQIRTFLQHAWSVATHDVTYKTATLSWRRERISYQVKALLEQAEVSVESISALEKSKALPETTQQYYEINKIIDLLQGNWPPDQLPTDVKRLGTTVHSLYTALKIKRIPDKFKKLLADGMDENGGAHPLDWSPYRSIINYLAAAHTEQLKGLLAEAGQRMRVFLYPETLDRLKMAKVDARAGVYLE